MTVHGTNFVYNSVVKVGSSSKTTTFVNDTTLTATIPVTDMDSAGTFSISVFNPTPGGGTSNSQTFTVNNVTPVTSELIPDTRGVGSAQFTIIVNGSNFVYNSVVRFEGSDRVTTFINSTQLQATILAGDQAVAGTYSITVFSPTPGGGTSNAQTFTVGNPLPTTESISPTTANVGGIAFSDTVTGTNFTAGSIVRVNGSNRTTTFISSTQVVATILASDIDSAGTDTIRVFNPTPGGGTSNPQILTVNNVVASISTLGTSSKNVGDAGFSETVNGSGFVYNSVVKFNGSSRTTTFVSSSQLTAQLLDTDLDTAGTFDVTVFNPTPGGGTSNAKQITVNNLVPTTTGINPTSKNVNDAEFSMTVTGTNFVYNSVVRINGNSRTTTYVDNLHLTAAILSSDIDTSGTFSITVFNPTPGGGTSNGQTFSVLASSISGKVFNDLNGDSIKQGGEPVLSGWKLYILGGLINDSIVTDGSGNYTFGSLPSATYIISTSLPSGKLITLPSTASSYTVTLSAGQDATGKDFGIYQYGTVIGMKFKDINGNGVKDAEDVGLQGWKVRLSGSSRNDTATTDVNGNYSFGNLLAGNYTISEIAVGGWTQTLPTSNGSYSASIISGSSFANFDFGNYPGAAKYRTLKATTELSVKGNKIKYKKSFDLECGDEFVLVMFLLQRVTML